MQKQFEEWAHDGSKGYKLKLWHLINQDGTKVYTNELTNDMWKAWQASRAAVVVKTDTMKDPSYEATGMVYLDAVEQALDEAGVSND
jgi:hypothetical protein